MVNIARFGILLAFVFGCACSKKAEAPPPSDSSAAEEACVDRWLEAHQLDAYGSPAGTAYAGGSPLFDERTGAVRDRLTYIYDHHPEVRALCSRASPGLQ